MLRNGRIAPFVSSRETDPELSCATLGFALPALRPATFSATPGVTAIMSEGVWQKCHQQRPQQRMPKLLTKLEELDPKNTGLIAAAELWPALAKMNYPLDADALGSAARKCTSRGYIAWKPFCAELVHVPAASAGSRWDGSPVRLSKLVNHFQQDESPKKPASRPVAPSPKRSPAKKPPPPRAPSRETAEPAGDGSEQGGDGDLAFSAHVDDRGAAQLDLWEHPAAARRALAAAPAPPCRELAQRHDTRGDRQARRARGARPLQ